MSAAILALLTIIGQIAPALGTSTAIQGVIGTLVQIVPTLVTEVTDVVPVVKNIISALQTNATITQDQLDQLAALDAQVDAAFEAAAGAYNPDGTLGTPPADPAA